MRPSKSLEAEPCSSRWRHGRPLPRHCGLLLSGADGRSTPAVGVRRHLLRPPCQQRRRHLPPRPGARGRLPVEEGQGVRRRQPRHSGRPAPHPGGPGRRRPDRHCAVSRGHAGSRSVRCRSTQRAHAVPPGRTSGPHHTSRLQHPGEQVRCPPSPPTGPPSPDPGRTPPGRPAAPPAPATAPAPPAPGLPRATRPGGRAPPAPGPRGTPARAPTRHGAHPPTRRAVRPAPRPTAPRTRRPAPPPGPRPPPTAAPRRPPPTRPAPRTCTRIPARAASRRIAPPGSCAPPTATRSARRRSRAPCRRRTGSTAGSPAAVSSSSPAAANRARRPSSRSSGTPRARASSRSSPIPRVPSEQAQEAARRRVHRAHHHRVRGATPHCTYCRSRHACRSAGFTIGCMLRSPRSVSDRPPLTSAAWRRRPSPRRAPSQGRPPVIRMVRGCGRGVRGPGGGGLPRTQRVPSGVSAQPRTDRPALRPPDAARPPWKYAGAPGAAGPCPPTARATAPSCSSRPACRRPRSDAGSP